MQTEPTNTRKLTTGERDNEKTRPLQQKDQQTTEDRAASESQGRKATVACAQNSGRTRHGHLRRIDQGTVARAYAGEGDQAARCSARPAGQRTSPCAVGGVGPRQQLTSDVLGRRGHGLQCCLGNTRGTVVHHTEDAHGNAAAAALGEPSGGTQRREPLARAARTKKGTTLISRRSELLLARLAAFDLGSS